MCWAYSLWGQLAFYRSGGLNPTNWKSCLIANVEGLAGITGDCSGCFYFPWNDAAGQLSPEREKRPSVLLLHLQIVRRLHGITSLLSRLGQGWAPVPKPYVSKSQILPQISKSSPESIDSDSQASRFRGKLNRKTESVGEVCGSCHLTHTTMCTSLSMPLALKKIAFLGLAK